MPEKFLRRDGLPLLLRHTGPTTLPERPPLSTKGPTILCLHDAGLQSSVFSDLLSSLAEDVPGCLGLSFDLPGHGRSGGLDSLPSIEAMAEITGWIEDWCEIERPILVGHGMGALIALESARTRGDSIRGLVLLGLGRILAVDDETIETMRRVTRGKAPRPFDPTRVANTASPDLKKRAYLEGIGTDPRATLADLEASRRWREAFSKESIRRCPIVVVEGAAESEPVRDRTAQFAASLSELSDTPVALIEDAAHFLPFEQPKAFARQIRQMAEATEKS